VTLPPGFIQSLVRSGGLVRCSPILGQAKLESVRVLAHEAMVAGEPFASAIGGLLPIALCGLTSLYNEAQ